MERIEDQCVGQWRPRVGRDDLASGHDHDSVHIALDRHHLKCERPRNAVPITVERDGLILVHWGGGTDHAGIETMIGKRRRRGLFLGESRSDHERAEESTEPFAPALLHSAAGNTGSVRRGPFTRGTGVENRRCTALTVFSASGFSLPRAGMQKRGLKT